MERDNQNNSMNDASAVRNESASAHSRRHFTILHAVLLLNVMMLTGFGVFAVMMFHRLAARKGIPDVQIISRDALAASDRVIRQGQPQEQESVQRQPDGSETDQGSILNEAISLETACNYYTQKEYSKAYYVFDQLRENISGRDTEQQCLRDWLSLQMGMCLHFTDIRQPASDFFSQALRSRSMFVRAMANYYLSLIQNENQQFLEARSRAYKSLALLKAVEGYIPETMESDCYFTAAESLTSHVLNMNNHESSFPGKHWTRTRAFYDLSIHDQRELSIILMSGIKETDRTALTPRVEYFPERTTGSQWTGICLDAPVEQLFWRIASEADMAVSWDDQARHRRRIPTTVFMPFVDRQYLMETIAGSAGLIWNYDGHIGVIQDPANYQDIQFSHQALCREAISIWQQFLIRYRNDERIANAHFCLGRLYEVYNDPSTALGHYKLTYGQFNRNDLAPYALLNAGKVKFAIQDYTGSKNDLNELLVHYPDFKKIGEVVLSLAEAMMNCDLYEEAANLYERAYRMDANDDVSRSALFGRGRCAYVSEDYQGCVEWLSKAINVTSDLTDVRRGPACLMLGRSFGKLGKYAQASGVLQMALGATLAQEDYVQILIELAQAEYDREEYINALNILENAPEDKLNQEDTCRVLLVKTKIFAMLDLTDAAISLLRRRIEFIADARLRAQLSMELAYCYMLNGDLTVAQRELNDAMYDLPQGHDRWRAGYLLAEIAYLEEDYKKAEKRCLQTLKMHVQDQEMRGSLYEMLGKIYTREQDYDNAALAFAGVIEETLLEQ